MTNTLIVPSAIPLTKAEIAASGQQLAEHVLDAGEQSPLAALIQLRALRDAIDHAIKGLEVAAMDEAAQYGRNDANWRGVGFTVRNGRTVYDYSHDPAWAEMKAQETAVAEQRKAREKFLQALPGEMVDPDTGEFIAPATIKNVTSSVLALTFPKE